MQLAGFHNELPYPEARKIFHAFGDVVLDAGGRGAIFAGPFAKALAQVIAVPESTVEYFCKALVPRGHLFGAERAVADGVDGLGIAPHSRGHILGAARTSLNLEHAHAGIYHAVEEVNGFQVFGRHDIFVLNVQLVAGLKIGDAVSAPANLGACTPVGTGIHLVEAEVALARHGHAQGAVAEHLDAHRFAFRATDVVALDGVADCAHLVEVELAGKDDHIGPLRVEPHGLGVGDIALGGYVDLHSAAAGIEDGGDVAGNYGRDSRRRHGVDHGTHALHVAVIHDGVDGEVGFDARTVAGVGDVAEVVEGEVGA